MVNLENIINSKIIRIEKYSKMNKGKNSVERNKKELFLYQNSEDLINVKEKQLKNVSKAKIIVDNDISKINSKLKKGYYLNQEIQEENPSIKTKTDELNYVLNKLNTNINILRNEIVILKDIKNRHENNCEKKLVKLNKELENLKEKRNIKIMRIFSSKIKKLRNLKESK